MAPRAIAGLESLRICHCLDVVRFGSSSSDLDSRAHVLQRRVGIVRRYRGHRGVFALPQDSMNTAFRKANRGI